MTPLDSAFAAFMKDHAAGWSAPAESLVVERRAALSREGQRHAGMLDRAGGAIVETALPERLTVGPAGAWEQEPRGAAPVPLHLAPCLTGDLPALNWRQGLIGIDAGSVEVRA